MQLSAPYASLKNSLQVIRYSIQVQSLELPQAEARTYVVLQSASRLREQIRIEVISDQQSMQENILEEEVQQAIQQRPAAGSELKMMKLLQSNGFVQEVDLRELIMRLIDQREGMVALDVLMRDLESLFQKNLVDISIKLSGSGR